MSSIESKLLFCKQDDIFKSQTAEQDTSQPEKKPNICAVPESQVLGKLKDFLGVISEANKRLQCDAKDNSQRYNIEELSGNESEYIEMDLMLGVADLHTPEAVAAAESAISGSQPVISLAASSSDDEDDDDDSDNDEDDESDNNDEKPSGVNGAKSSSETNRKNHSKKRPRIIELS